MSTSTNAITPYLQAKLDKAREERRNSVLWHCSRCYRMDGNLIVLRIDSLWMKFRYLLKLVGHHNDQQGILNI